MRVSIKHDEQLEGIIFKRARVYLILTLELADEEKEIVRRRNLADREIQWFETYGLKSPMLHKEFRFVRVRDVLLYKTFVYAFESADESKLIEDNFRQATNRLKDMLFSNRDVGDNEVFDL